MWIRRSERTTKPLWQFRLNIFIFSRFCRIVTRIQIKYLHKWADSRTHFRIRYIFEISYRRSRWSAWRAYVNCTKRFFGQIRICWARLWQRRWNIINVIDDSQGFFLANFCLAQGWIDRLINRCRRSERTHTPNPLRNLTRRPNVCSGSCSGRTLNDDGTNINSIHLMFRLCVPSGSMPQNTETKISSHTQPRNFGQNKNK